MFVKIAKKLLRQLGAKGQYQNKWVKPCTVLVSLGPGIAWKGPTSDPTCMVIIFMKMPFYE